LIHIHDPAALWRNGDFPKGRGDHPVSFVTIDEATKFCKWLDARYKLPGSFRLPIQDEWLFAAYGTDRKFPWGDVEREYTGKSTEPVKSRPELRTPDGIYGIWGNVSELVLSRSNGYGGRIDHKDEPWITKWLGEGYRIEEIRGEAVKPRQDYWGYTHSAYSRSDEWGFRIVFVPK
jgi:formylglycine-generating enzyme required for sulfatase activity